MPYVKYSTAQKAEAVALAEVLGLSVAAEQLGIEERSIAEWMRRAGRSPADSIEPASWERLARLAMTKAEHMVATGKLSAAQLINAASMAETRATTSKVAGADSALAAKDAFLDWLPDRLEAMPLPASVVDEPSLDVYLDALAAALDALTPELLRRANAEPGSEAFGSHRTALLSWHSGRLEWQGQPIEAGDLLVWAKAQVEDILAKHGDLVTWHERILAAETRQRVIRDRREVLRESGVAFPEAHALAVELTTDHPDPFAEEAAA